MLVPLRYEFTDAAGVLDNKALSALHCLDDFNIGCAFQILDTRFS